VISRSRESWASPIGLLALLIKSFASKVVEGDSMRGEAHRRELKAWSRAEASPAPTIYGLYRPIRI